MEAVGRIVEGMDRKEKGFAELNPEIGSASDADLPEVARLQQDNLTRNVAEEEQRKEGFVSVETPPELLKEIANQEGITVAKVGGKVVGYLMPMTVAHAKRIPLLDPFIERFTSLSYEVSMQS